jgi:hypothetical protein
MRKDLAKRNYVSIFQLIIVISPKQTTYSTVQNVEILVWELGEGADLLLWRTI